MAPAAGSASFQSPRTPRSGGRAPWGNYFFSPSRSMFVVDPRTMATRMLVKPSIGAYESTNTRVVKFFVWVKKVSKKWFSHVFFLLGLIIYACIGGAIFNKIEGGFEAEQNQIIRTLREPIDNTSELVVQDLWLLRNRFPMPTGNKKRKPLPVDINWNRRAMRLLERFETVVSTQCRKRLEVNIDRDHETDKWSFIGSVFFSMTVFTTIGYGENPPVTTAGKVATCIYAFIGIPLLLMVLADFGKIFTKAIKLAVLYVRRLYYLRSFREVRHFSRRANKAARVQKAIMDNWAKLQRNPPFYVDPKTGKVTMLPPTTTAGDVEAGRPKTAATAAAATPFRFAPRAGRAVTPTTPGSSPETPMPPEVDFDDMDDEFNLPISLALFILMLYLFLGAIIFWSSENWSMFHSFYFVFISMSTIGFGDFIPTQYLVLLYAFIYFLFGLALTSMCINVIQEKLSSTFERARMTIGETIGLDPSTPITIVNPTGEQNDEQQKKKKDGEQDGKKEGKATTSSTANASNKPADGNDKKKSLKSALKSPQNVSAAKK